MRALEVIVLDAERQFVDYVHPAFARKLLKEQAASVYSKEPFVIQVKDRASLSPKKDSKIMITNFTEYFKAEKDVYVQNVSNCQVSVSFEVGPGHSESFLFTNSKDPVNLTRFIPFHAIKGSMDLRKMLNRVPPALKLMENTDFEGYYKKQATTAGTSLEQAIDKAEARRASAQNHTPLPEAEASPVVESNAAKESPVVSEQDEINARVLHLCLQVHPSVPDQSKMSAQTLLAELDGLESLTMLDWEYVQSHGFYKSVKNQAKKKISELAADMGADDDVPAPKKPAKKAKATVAAAE